MNLAIDIGNTFAKIGVFDKQLLTETYEKLSPEAALAVIRRYKPDYLIVADVAGRAADIIRQVTEQGWVAAANIITLHPQLPVPVKNLYQTPQTLGMDRLAAVVGAWTLFPHTNCLVIDAGTCITYDIITGKAEYLGGSISPGLQMRFKALHHFTAKLPLLGAGAADENTPLTGSSTPEAIFSGVIHGMTCEIEGIINAYRHKFADLCVLICGGDAEFFEKKIKPPIFVRQQLLLTGLNSILQYNIDSNTRE